MTVGSRIRELRKQHNYTLLEVAEYLNISRSQLALIERGEKNLKLTKLLKLCDLYNVSEEYILYGDGDDGKQGTTFQSDEEVDLSLVARMNRIIRNLKLLREIEEDIKHEENNQSHSKHGIH